MQNKKRKIFIIAGEVSGDCLGARVMRHMSDTEFCGIGGAEMQSCGLKSLFPMGDLSVMGITEVLFHARTLTRRIKQTVKAIIEEKPDMVLTIDSPGFARSVIKKLRKCSKGRDLIANGMRFHHIVAPQVWAWRPGRAKKYAKIFDKLYAFFDFEVPFFTKYGLDTIAVGHPVAESLLGTRGEPSRKNPNEKIITLVPGSRMTEVRKLMPIFKVVVETLQSCGYMGYKFAIPVVETTADYVRAHIKDWSVAPELVDSKSRYDLYRRTYVAIVASGTVSAELAMLHIPAIITYKMNPVTVWFAHRWIRVRWVSLVNILLDRGVYPECLGGDANPDKIIDTFDNIILPANRAKMISELAQADKMWLRPDGMASQLIADDIKKSLLS
ncbi:MAG: lipid-A-disaccharide synthase [Alphaproteobacteria bacterium]|nr:lipid-A-disaccharide synthase [Alphaproteobacteria bacterium]